MAQYTPYLKLVFVGVLLASVLTGGFGLTVVALTALIAALLIATRPDVIPALIAIAIGAVIVILFPQFSLQAVDPVTALACCVAVMML